MRVDRNTLTLILFAAISSVSLAAHADPIILDFDFEPGSNPDDRYWIENGTLGADLYQLYIDPEFGGVTIFTDGPDWTSNDQASHPPQIFYTGDPTYDRDLGSPNQYFGGTGIGSGGELGQLGQNDEFLGNVLIISEHNDQQQPDDNVRGGSLFFDFDGEGVDLGYVDILDLDIGISTIIRAFDVMGNVMKDVRAPDFGNNAFARVGLQVEDVYRLEVEFSGSGAVAELCFAASGPSSFDPGCGDMDSPTADAGGDYAFSASSLSIDLMGSGSSDQDGQIIDYSWHANNEEVPNGSNPAGHWYNQNPNAVLSIENSGITSTTSGLSEVSLTVTDETSLSDTGIAQLAYLNAAPTVESISATENSDLSVTFDLGFDDIDLNINALIADFEAISSYELLFNHQIIFSADILTADLQTSTSWNRNLLDSWFGGAGDFLVDVRVTDQAGLSSMWSSFNLSLSQDETVGVESPSTFLLFALALLALGAHRRKLN